MIRVRLLLFTFPLLMLTPPAQSMEVPQPSAQPILFNLPKEEETAFIFDIVAYCQVKDNFRQTCRYFNNFIVRKREQLLKSKLLCLSNEALTKYALYYGHLGDTDIVLNLLDKGFDPNTSINMWHCNTLRQLENEEQMADRTLFHYAAHYGYSDIANALLKHPKLIKENLVRIEDADTAGIDCPFMIAIKNNQDDIVKKILAACRSACTIDYDHALETAEESLAHNVIQILATEENMSPEGKAIAEQCLTGIADIEKMASEIDIKTDAFFNKNFLEKLIFDYAHWGDIATTSKLLAHNFAITNPEDGSTTPSTIDGESTLCWIANKGSLNAVRTLLACNISPNATSGGLSALLNAIATDTGNLPIIKLLISKGASLTYRDKSRRAYTALHAAILCGHTHATQLLINCGADISIQSENGGSPLHTAIVSPCTSIIEILLNKSADVNAQDDLQRTPLHYAVEDHHEYGVKRLLTCPDIKVNAKTLKGNTPLHVAILFYKDSTTLIEALLGHDDLNINAENNEEKTALDLVPSEHTELIDLLIRHGAKKHDQLCYHK